MRVSLDRARVAISLILLFVFGVLTFLGFYYWLVGKELPFSILITCTPISLILLASLSISNVLSVANAFLLLILYAILRNEFYFFGLEYIYNYSASDIVFDMRAVYIRWLVLFSIGIAVTVLYKVDPGKLFLVSLVYWIALVAVASILTYFGMSFKEIAFEFEVTRVSYRHIFSDLSAISAFGLMCYSRYKILIFIATNGVILTFGGMSSFVIFTISCFLYWFVIIRENKFVSLYILASIFLIPILIYMLGDFLELLGKKDSFIVRLDLLAMNIDRFIEAPLFGEYLGYLRYRDGHYIHSFISYLTNYGLLFFSLSLSIILYNWSKLRSTLRFSPLVFYVVILMVGAKSFQWGFDWFLAGVLSCLLFYKRRNDLVSRIK